MLRARSWVRDNEETFMSCIPVLITKYRCNYRDRTQTLLPPLCSFTRLSNCINEGTNRLWGAQVLPWSKVVIIKANFYKKWWNPYHPKLAFPFPYEDTLPNYTALIPWKRSTSGKCYIFYNFHLAQANTWKVRHSTMCMISCFPEYSLSFLLIIYSFIHLFIHSLTKCLAGKRQ